MRIRSRCHVTPNNMALRETSSDMNEEDDSLDMVQGRCPIHWKPTSTADLAHVEKRILKSVRSTIRRRYVQLNQNNARIWTLIANTHHNTTPIVMVHGMGGGLAMWVQSLDALAQHRPVYMFDMLGFGRSSRPDFSSDPMVAEEQLVNSLEEWRQNVGLDKFILLGHSLGGYLCTLYAMQYPERVEHLIAVDPWGYQSKPEDYQERAPLWVRAVFRVVISLVNPFSFLRAAGPLGPRMLKRFRSDLEAKFADYLDDEDGLFLEYIYHCNVRKPSGEVLAKTLQKGIRWAKHPILKRIHNLDSEIPMTFIHGKESWLPNDVGYTVQKLRWGSHVNVETIAGAGHHVYADRPLIFNFLVNGICTTVDTKTSGSPRHVASEMELEEMEGEPV